MPKKMFWRGALCCVGLSVLILDARTALEGARLGIDLCLKTVIPSLFPFFVLSIMLTSALSGLCLPLLHPIGRFFGIPQGSESILICAFLGGYPVGAQNVARAYRERILTRREAERMLAFCSNAGPAFIFGMTSSLFPETWMSWMLWGIHIASAIGVSMVFSAENHQTAKLLKGTECTMPEALHIAVGCMASVCGWVVLFRVLISVLSRWALWLFDTQVQTAMIGLLELSNGCCQLMEVDSISTRFILCSAFLAFGGLCVAMQTASVTDGLSMKNYWAGKLLQTIISVILSVVLLRKQLFPFLMILALFVFFVIKKQKEYSIQRAVGV